MRKNINAILEGLHCVNEAALPKNVLSLMSDELKKDLRTFIDINNAKVHKIKGPRDEKYKDAYMRLYVLKNGSEYSKKNGRVVITYNALYFDDPKSITNAVPKWEFVNPRIKALPKPSDVEEYYVLLNTDLDYNSQAKTDSVLKGTGRKIARNTQDPHTAYAGKFVDTDGNVTDKGAYYSAKVGEKTRQTRKDIFTKALSDEADKFGFKFTRTYPTDTNTLFRIKFDDTKNQNMGIDIRVNKNSDIELYPNVPQRPYNEAVNLKDFKNYVDMLSDLCERAMNLEKNLKSNKDVKETLKLLKDNKDVWYD